MLMEQADQADMPVVWNFDDKQATRPKLPQPATHNCASAMAFCERTCSTGFKRSVLGRFNCLGAFTVFYAVGLLEEYGGAATRPRERCAR